MNTNQLEKRDSYTFKSGAIYDGEWRGNMRFINIKIYFILITWFVLMHREGNGIQKWPDGARYDGTW